jgi:hypothetical protein
LKTKKDDLKFCGVDSEKIKSAKPTLNEEVLKYHHLYITERTEIYKKKEILKLPQPWTEDEVFLKYRFTNVRRELDRESKWLIQNVCENDNLSLKDKIVNCILFRTFNKSETSELINMPIVDIETINLDKYEQIFIKKAEEDPKYVFFTPAFMTGGLKKGNAFKNEPYVRRVATLVHPDGTTEEMEYIKARDICNSNDKFSIIDWAKNIPTRMLRFVQRYTKNGIVEEILECKTQEDVFNILSSITGFGHFLAYQVFVDLTYIPEFKFSENEFTVSGPGCSAGIELLFDDLDGMTHEEAIFWVRDNIENEWDNRELHVDMTELFDFLPEEDRKLNVMSLENCFCELSKLTKAKRGTGRPRNKYEPTQQIKEKLEEW